MKPKLNELTTLFGTGGSVEMQSKIGCLPSVMEVKSEEKLGRPTSSVLKG